MPPKQKTIVSFFQKATPVKSPAPAKSHTETPPPKAGLPIGSPSSDLKNNRPLSSSSAGLATPSSALDCPTANTSVEMPSSPLVNRKRRAIDSDSEEEEDEDDEDDVASEVSFEDSEDDFEPASASEHEDDDVPPQEVVSEESADEEVDEMEVDSEEEEVRKPRKKSASKTSSISPRNSSPVSAPVSAGASAPVSAPSSAGASASPAAAAADGDLLKFDAGSDYVPGPRSLPAIKKAKIANEPSEERYKWLLDIKDADGNRPDHPEYDPRTLYVPSSAWSKFTPFEKQYWEIKSKLWNTVVFFKKGKFYELYENDAQIAHQQFDLKLAGGGRANMSLAGIPEMSFDYWASAFIAKGYKVARVDQKETALAKEMADRTAGKKEEKIIKRQLSCVLTAGTLTNEAMLVDDLSQYCLAVKQDGSKFAACFVDTATGAFSVTEFQDDDDYNHLETLVAQTRPRELVLERGNLDRVAMRILRNNVSVDTLWNIIKPVEEFYDADTALQRLARAKYFAAEDLDDFSNYPQVLVEAKDSDLLMSAIGGLLWYLHSLKLDEQLMSLGNFSKYTALNKGAGAMILDGQTLQNLEVFANTFDGSAEGTVFKLLNKCITPFGKRRLRAWVAHPLQDLQQITARQDAVDLLMSHDELREQLEQRLVGLPDIERLLSRIHANSLRPRDFVRVVAGLETMAKVLEWLKGQNFEVPLIDELIRTAPPCKQLLEQWLTAFDHELAKNDDTLVPEPGVEEEFDASRKVITDIEAQLDSKIKEYRKEYRSLTISYKDSGKEIYLIEMPAKVAVPSNWQQMSATAKVKRYWSPEVRTLVRELQEARETHKVVAEGVQGRLYARFSKNYLQWLDTTKTIGNIDCLVSLARTSNSMPTHCRPKFVDAERTVLKFTELRHPCMQEFIPNTVELGGDKATMSLLTGANAAGKSTVLRMTGTAVILAQLGCHVPAVSAELTACDRIMTRLGASDNIFAGKSTFHVELSETERILSKATARTLVVIDELGRGGSSSDGFAIAEAVLHQLATYTGCVGFFATHYGTLADSFRTHPEVRPQTMAILVDKDSREVTFLYKLQDGQSEGSFGMNVAAMCGVSAEIVAAAEKAAKEHEHTQRLGRVGYQGVPLGLQSDAVWTLRELPVDRAVAVMKEMSRLLA